VKARAALDATLLRWPARVIAAETSQAAVTAPFPGRISRCLTRPGAAVAKGAPLVEMIVPELAQAAASVAAAEVRLAAYRERQSQLRALRAEGLARVDELADVDMRMAEARADALRAQAVLRVAGLAPTDAPALASSGGVVTLRAPLAGVVTFLDAPMGEARGPGDGPLARLASPGAVRVEGRLGPELPAVTDLHYVFLGASGVEVPLQLAALSPSADARDGLRTAWFDPAPGKTAKTPSEAPSATASALASLVPGVPGVLAGRLGASSPELVVPARAVGRRGGRPFVWRRKGDGTEIVPVELALLSGGEALVRGLREGDLVAAEAPPEAAATESGQGGP
jgi:multidrug efflux pump subunit AcrA (membrane-fusion protein)